jgi:nucleotide-binding universal stress UspA family protein
MKKVLIALDYDQSSEKVLAHGYELAKAMDSEITLLHVISDPVYYSTSDYSPILGFSGFSDATAISLENEMELKQSAEDFLNHNKSQLKDWNVQILVKEGDFAECILEAANETMADVIVIGSHSKRWLEGVFSVTITEKVLNDSSVPLYIIPTKKED